MKIHSIRLRHCYHFADLSLHFKYSNKPITVILGDQSCGKTAILKNIYQSLTWFSARLKDARTSGVVMLDSDVMRDRMQSKIEVSVQFSPEIGKLSESSTSLEKDVSIASWHLYKTLNTSGLGHSKIETHELEQLAHLYNRAIQQDPLQGLPLIAYYPTDRFVNEMNLISKNNPGVFLSFAAYELAAIPYTTFSRFFEWFREVSDVENAQTAQLFQHILGDYKKNRDATFETTFNLTRSFFQNHSAPNASCLSALKVALNKVLPDLTDLYLEYLPKLQLMVTYKGKTVPFTQLSNSIRNWIALVGDIVRRLCLLNPNSLFPCLEGEGILMIDNIEAQLDQESCQNILERLHQAFPQVQIIATGSNPELLEYADEYQYLKLEDKTIHEISLSEASSSFSDILKGLFTEEHIQRHDDLTDPILSDQSVQSMYEKFQYLTTEQQNELIKLIKGNGNIPSEKI